MKKQRERKFWSSMFLSYLLITTLCFLLFVAVVLVSSYELGRQKFELENERVLNSVRAILEDKCEAVENIISNINNSLAFRPLYLSLVGDKEMNTVERVNMQNTLISITAKYVPKGVEDLVVFLDGQTHAYSGSGMIILSSPFDHMSFPAVFCTVDSISSLLNIGAEKYSFRRNNLLFAASFRYEGGTERGVIAVSFDKAQLERMLLAVAPNVGVRVSFNGQPILENAFDGALNVKSFRDKSFPALSVELAFRPYSASDFTWNRGVVFSLLIGSAVFLCMLVLSFLFSMEYYKPLRKIKSIVRGSGRMEGDEINAMIGKLEDMVVEYGEYKDNLSDIAPYVEKGLFHGYVVNRKTDRSEYAIKTFGFAKPYYYVIAALFDSKDTEETDEILSRMRKLFSTEETRVSFYMRDPSSAFISINTDSHAEQTPLVESIYTFLVGAFEREDSVTFGVDVIRTDLSDLAEACNSALVALENMLIQGKGEIYYAEDTMCQEEGYYLPQGFEIVLLNAIREDRTEDGIKSIDEVLETNLMKYDLSPKSVHHLSDEVYYSLVKCARGLALDMKSPKADNNSTLEEAFDYYKDIYKRIGEVYRAQTEKEKEEYGPLIAFVDENYTMPDLSQKLLCEKFHVSAKTITNCFMRQFGITYLKYVTGKRIEKAKVLLTESNDSIDSIALSSGYSNALSFRRNFKDETGFTPSEYRAKFGN